MSYKAVLRGDKSVIDKFLSDHKEVFSFRILDSWWVEDCLHAYLKYSKKVPYDELEKFFEEHGDQLQYCTITGPTCYKG